ncbi:MAG: hypothetical protein VXW06_01580 [Pseudomonadota bacterium]|nr:hypothetical protein [Pseudomonadota bacterium]
MSRFQVGLSAGLFGADGSPCFDPDILEKLYQHEGIDPIQRYISNINGDHR